MEYDTRPIFLVYAEFILQLCLSLMHYNFLKVEGGAEAVNDMASTMMQKFWDSALALEPADEEFDTHRYLLYPFHVVFC